MKPTMDQITRSVCAAHGVEMTQLKSRRRDARITQVRHMAYWLCRQVKNNSYPKIGRYFDRDHSTIMHGVEKFDQQVRADPVLRKMTKRAIDCLERRMGIYR